MRYTNIHNLPKTIVNAVTADHYVKAGRIGVTSLISAPRQVILRNRNHDQIIEDVADNIWRMFGSHSHQILEESTTSGMKEFRVKGIFSDWKVTGIIDLYEDGILYDYKVTSVWAAVFGLKPEWEAQINCYHYLFKRGTVRYTDEVSVAKIIAILRDWNKRRAATDKDYPNVQVVTMDVPLWPLKKTEQYIKDRVKLHQECQDLSEVDLPHCTPEEMWERPTTYAVNKGKNKRALRVFDTELEAIDFCEGHKDERKLWVETRPGEKVRCESYCSVSGFCSQYLGVPKTMGG
jgi:hypothetical protein